MLPGARRRPASGHCLTSRAEIISRTSSCCLTRGLGVSIPTRFIAGRTISPSDQTARQHQRLSSCDIVGKTRSTFHPLSEHRLRGNRLCSFDERWLACLSRVADWLSGCGDRNSIVPRARAIPISRGLCAAASGLTRLIASGGMRDGCATPKTLPTPCGDGISQAGMASARPLERRCAFVPIRRDAVEALSLHDHMTSTLVCQQRNRLRHIGVV